MIGRVVLQSDRFSGRVGVAEAGDDMMQMHSLRPGNPCFGGGIVEIGRAWEEWIVDVQRGLGVDELHVGLVKILFGSVK